MSKNLQPKIRFKGFSDDWIEINLGNTGCIQSGIGFPDHEQGGEVGFCFYKVSDMNIQTNEFIMKIANNYVTQEQITKNRWNIIEKVPSLLFAKVGAAIFLNRKRLVLNPFLIDNNVMAYSFDSTWHPYFGKALFDTLYLPKYAQVGALPSMNAKDVSNIKVVIPPITEQQKIGDFFQSIDQDIALQEEKLIKTQNLKKAMLEKMFLKAGSKQPEVRFDGFSGDWEEKKINHILRIRSGRSQKNIEDKNGIYPILATGGEIGRTNTALYTNESVLIGRKGTIDKPYYMNSPFWTVDTLFFSELFNSVDGFFVYTLFQKIDWRKHNTSTGVPSLTSSAIHDIDIFISPNKKEQEKIGNYFKELDKAIALQSEQLEKLKNIKKAYLAKMFV